MVQVLITGGAGYIGSTVASALVDAGHSVVVVDDLSTGDPRFAEGRNLSVADVRDEHQLDAVFERHPDVSAVVHCAARIVVPESVLDPIGYYQTNVGGTLSLLSAMRRHGVRAVVFSSSASVYAARDGGLLPETSELAPSSPYARSKLLVEEILSDAAATGAVCPISLRYFNPIGADPLLRSGNQILQPSHVLGKLITAWENGQPFTITGTDWPTRDGSGMRDFIHVWDLAQAHVRAVEALVEGRRLSHHVYNVGGGVGTTVRELTEAFRRVVGQNVEIRSGERRPGDVAGGYADPTRARRDLGWVAERDLETGIRDSIAWRHRLLERARSRD